MKQPLQCESCIKNEHQNFLQKIEKLSGSTIDTTTMKIEEITFEGVEYVEDMNTGKVYSLGYEHLGEWNGDCDKIIWVNDGARINHDAKKQMSD